MTAHEIIKTGFGLMYENSEADVKAARFSRDVLNILIAECFDAENNSRADDDRLTTVPFISSSTDTVPYNDHLCRVALPYGIAWKYAEENLNQYQAEWYRAKYEEARRIAGGAKWMV